MATRIEPLIDPSHAEGADRSIGEELVGWGKVASIETVGRMTGTRVTAAVGFIEDADGSLLVAAGNETADWALNLRAEPRTRVTIGDTSATYLAAEANDTEKARAVTELILKYGTPAERLGRGPVFRLRPTGPTRSAGPG
ncbi:MAG TPA: nitroreductase family deazaflavin-dependent oxidoreductase [Candidatus Limnocylindrales bacterium]|nr:nitroreductase family deazaflavin-dependent oxidoreductase [Candidatus Limnocylindrales bacterium]